MVIRHNMLAINARRQYGMAAEKMSSDAEKLSSGYRINKSADDAAGLSISEKMRRQIRGLTRGIHNTEEGISLCQVADGALNEVHDIVQRLNNLSVQAANGTNRRSDREMLQKEVDQLLTEINRISDTTTFNGLNLFSGENCEVEGYDAQKYAPYSYVFDRAAATRTGASSSEATAAAAYVLNNTSSADYTLTAPAPRATTAATGAGVECGEYIVFGGDNDPDYGDYSYDAATNKLTIYTNTALTIKAKGSKASLDNIIFDTTLGFGANITLQGKFTVDGNYKIPDSASTIKLTFLSSLAIAPSATLTLGNKAVLNADAGGVKVDKDGKGAGVQVQDGAKLVVGKSAEVWLWNAGYLYIADGGQVENKGAIVARGGSGVIYAPSMSYINGFNGGFGLKYQILDQSGEPFPQPDPPKLSEPQKSQAPQESQNSPQPISAYAYVKRRFMKKWWIQSGNDAYDGMHVDIDAMNIKTLGLLGLNVTTQQNADKAINTIDGALSYVSKMRSKIGAQQNRLEHIVLNENNIVENTVAAESRIRDADMAKGMAAFSISNILVRAGETMLAQANTSNEGAMALMR